MLTLGATGSGSSGTTSGATCYKREAEAPPIGWGEAAVVMGRARPVPVRDRDAGERGYGRRDALSLPHVLRAALRPFRNRAVCCAPPGEPVLERVSLRGGFRPVRGRILAPLHG